MNIFNVKTKVFMGEGALEHLKTVTRIKRAYIICDPFIESSGLLKQLTNVLDDAHVEYTVFAKTVPDAPIAVIKEGLALAFQYEPDTLIAMGGGSAIDTAKAINHLYYKVAKADKWPYFVAIPTTSGTGSEVTNFSVISDPEQKLKYPLVDDDLLPNIAILEPELVRSVPPHITADTGMDVLTHALEAYVSKDANDFTGALAEKSIRFIFKYLPKAYKDPGDMRARSKVHNASCMAGIAFNHASLGINHSMAHALGGMFHIPHGRANAIMLPYVIDFNSSLDQHPVHYTRAANQYAFAAELMGWIAPNSTIGVNSLIRGIIDFEKGFGIEPSIRSQGISEQDFYDNLDAMVEAAINDKCTKTNPREVTREQLKAIYVKAYYGKYEMMGSVL